VRAPTPARPADGEAKSLICRRNFPLRSSGLDPPTVALGGPCRRVPLALVRPDFDGFTILPYLSPGATTIHAYLFTQQRFPLSV